MLERKEEIVALTNASNCSESELRVAFNAPEISLLKKTTNLKVLCIEGILDDYDKARNWTVVEEKECEFDLPEVEELYLDAAVLSKSYLKSILDKQPQLKVLGLTFKKSFFDRTSLERDLPFPALDFDLFNKRFFATYSEEEFGEYLKNSYSYYHVYCLLETLDSFLEDYPKLEKIELAKNTFGHLDHLMSLRQREAGHDLIGVYHYFTSWECVYLSFLDGISTLESFRAPHWFDTYGNADGMMDLVQRNKSLHTFQFSWDAPLELLALDIPVFMAEQKKGYRTDSPREKNRIKLAEQFADHLDPELQKKLFDFILQVTPTK